MVLGTEYFMDLGKLDLVKFIDAQWFLFRLKKMFAANLAASKNNHLFKSG
jgi:hypothetical protein